MENDVITPIKVPLKLELCMAFLLVLALVVFDENGKAHAISRAHEGIESVTYINIIPEGDRSDKEV